MGLCHDSSMVPRNGHTWGIGFVARISGCANQKEVSLEDQVDHGKEVAAEYCQGPAEYRVVATKGKGERLDRPELDEIEALLRTGELDLLVAEDIGRIIRGADAVRLCGIAVDHGTRVIAPNDCIDTMDENWEEDVLDACKEHVGHNRHTSKRIKKKLMNRFMKFGGAAAFEIFGYIKPPGAKTFDDWQKDPAATEIYQEWKRRLRETLNCSAVADWLNQRGVPTGKHARRKTWDGATVRRVTANPLLKGMPRRGLMHSIKHHETGRRISVKNPSGPKYYECPKLAFWTPDEFDELNALLAARNGPCKRKPVNGTDPRSHVPRKRTRFPGQYACCTYCGHECVWGGNGVTENLMCSGAREWHCWNSVGFNGLLAAREITEAISAELYDLEGFDAQFRDLVREVGQPGDKALAPRWEQLLRNEEAQKRKKANLAASMAEYGPMPMIEEGLAEIRTNEQKLARERRELESLKTRALQLPTSVTELRHLLEEQFQKLAVDSPEFGDLLRQLVPEFHVQLVRLCDGGHLMPQARVKLDLGGSIPDVKHAPELNGMLARELTLDLFQPPQRERIRIETVCLAATGLSPRQIAPRLSEKATATAVHNALALDRKMRELGLETPYVLVREPPDDYPKQRRHKNPKYRFEPLEGYPKLPV
jgi:site-specific DNA recombinase